MRLESTIGAVTGMVIGALMALVFGLVVTAVAGPDGGVVPATTPALITCAGAITGGLIGLFSPR
jgi:hypothetical protein